MLLNKLAIVPLSCLLLAATADEVDPKIPPIERIEGVEPKPSVPKSGGWKTPLAIRTEKQAVEYFGKDEAVALKKKVDFGHQFVLVVAWRGSGQDQLDYVVAESYPEQVRFSVKPGRTRDLRSHVYVYALRSNVQWSIR